MEIGFRNSLAGKQVTAVVLRCHGITLDAEEKIALLAEHARACLRRYGYSAEVMPKAFMDGETPVTEFPDQAAALAAGLAERNADGLLQTGEFGTNVRFGTVFTDAPWKKGDA